MIFSAVIHDRLLNILVKIRASSVRFTCFVSLPVMIFLCFATKGFVTPCFNVNFKKKLFPIATDLA